MASASGLPRPGARGPGDAGGLGRGGNAPRRGSKSAAARGRLGPRGAGARRLPAGRAASAGDSAGSPGGPSGSSPLAALARAAASALASASPGPSVAVAAAALLAAAAMQAPPAAALLPVIDPRDGGEALAYDFTVPLKLAAPRGAVPGQWSGDFAHTQGPSASLQLSSRGTPAELFNSLLKPKRKERDRDAVSLGDAWLTPAIAQGLISPLPESTELAPWWRRLPPPWRALLRRDAQGRPDARGRIYGAPHRFGCLLFAYKPETLRPRGLAVNDWPDLWQAALTGRVAMPNAPRLAVAAALRSLGLPASTPDPEASAGSAVRGRLSALRQQARLFDDGNYLRALAAGDAWVAVGWSDDILPFVERTPGFVAAAPASGTLLTADIWTLPAPPKPPAAGAAAGPGGLRWPGLLAFVRGRLPGKQQPADAGAAQESAAYASPPPPHPPGPPVRTPSPLLTPWFEFCLMPARARPAAGLRGGASPLLLPGAAPGSGGELVAPPPDWLPPAAGSRLYAYGEEPTSAAAAAEASGRGRPAGRWGDAPAGQAWPQQLLAQAMGPALEYSRTGGLVTWPPTHVRLPWESADRPLPPAVAALLQRLRGPALGAAPTQPAAGAGAVSLVPVEALRAGVWPHPAVLARSEFLEPLTPRAAAFFADALRP